ncbi:hypothetical protein MJO28_015982 [Puccinia striiformis f. sp. tritici]|uniref:RING-type domain-containing protein n=3 Tax=Puccinia striiformis TaxID=27350 RepID=A0A0L0VCQ4_9BASI|nr:hypothetical protein Pst134EA_028990 [Puccinia striiformis f. sp. tritici]KNE97077.1 hypothetical protein PSTG_09651 [Puccinia striiformis f. sp. tritici PST-78]POW08315.1 hypothetical protein PSTT_07604 [Puccinia striiformis]KAH9441039.1 hypothetical protein Pst134EB_029688 [Puccinia striiformis f. sp. tritici]KAH9447006.1 hypothetical protein Pst134EA_028990 [Puccinia striiformis f. sp. tritici]KAI7936110.1 hypothetical protein MJO29_015413 [Puccinia striiformis f. sp. tritici]
MSTSTGRIISLPTCSICRDDEAGIEMVATTCGHIFHAACIRDWDRSRMVNRLLTKCPSCNVGLRHAGQGPIPLPVINLHSLTEREINDQGVSKVTDWSERVDNSSQLRRFQEELASLRARNVVLEERNAQAHRQLALEREQRREEHAANVKQDTRSNNEIYATNKKYILLHDHYINQSKQLSNYRRERAKLRASEVALRAKLRENAEILNSLETTNPIYKRKLDKAKRRINTIRSPSRMSI